nr:MAG TPA: hypothetical protein [Caudoviricetes sp.]
MDVHLRVYVDRSVLACRAVFSYLGKNIVLLFLYMPWRTLDSFIEIYIFL